MWYAPEDRVFQLKGLLDDFSRLGVDPKLVNICVQDLVRFHILRGAFGIKAERAFADMGVGQLSLSRWGSFFRNHVAMDLPYISTVWWSTHMLERFSLGKPRQIVASDLRGLSGVFLRWLRNEQNLAFRSLRLDELKHEYYRPSDLFREISFNVTYSLQRIDLSLAAKRGTSTPLGPYK